MKTTLLQRCQNLEKELHEQCEGSGTCTISQAEANLLNLVDELTTAGHRKLADDLKTNVETLTLRARLHKARAEALADHLGEDARTITDTMQTEVQEIRSEVEGTNAYDEAAVAINRRVHQTTGTFKDIVKGLLMWVDTPEEVLQKQRKRDKGLVS